MKKEFKKKAYFVIKDFKPAGFFTHGYLVYGHFIINEKGEKKDKTDFIFYPSYPSDTDEKREAFDEYQKKLEKEGYEIIEKWKDSDIINPIEKI